MKKFWDFVSVVFHPVFLPSVATYLYLERLPAFYSHEVKQIVFYLVIGFTLVFPLSLLFSLKTMGIVKNIRTTSIEERKIPFIIMMGAFLFLGVILDRIGTVKELVILSFANVMALLLTFLLFYKGLKSSIHMIGITSLTSFSILIAEKVGFSVYVFAALILCCGLVGTARLHLKAHTFKEVIIGAFLGFVFPFVALLYYKM